MIEATLEKDLSPYIKPVSLRLLSLSAGLLALTASLMAASVWFVKKESLRSFSARSAKLTHWVQTNSQEIIDQHLQGLATIAQPFAAGAADAPAHFQPSAADILKKCPAFTAINHINQDFIIDDVHPLAANRNALRLDIKSRFDVLPVAHRAITHRKTSVTDFIDLVQGGKGVILYEPIVREERWAGFIEGVFRLNDFNALFLEKFAGPDYNFTIIDETNGREIYTSLPSAAVERSTPFDTYFTMRLGDRTWWVILHPKSPPLILLPLVFVLLLEICLGAFGLYWLWKSEHA
ncbi:MAG TPA: CHASE domain-containing protein [Elusimicrobiota bacterium]|nr:CHASE domain-containing protein [Elusimicrobiota bacterium]